MSKQKDKKEVFQPDDKPFKKVMEQPKNARAYLKNFYPEMASHIDLDTLHLESTTFTDSQLQSFHSDIIYRCKFKDSDENLFFSLLWENKSIADDYVVLQLGVYIAQALYKMSKENDAKLEPIIPLVFYNGKKDWTPKTLTDLFKNHPHFNLFKSYLPTFDFQFKNIAKMHKDELLAIQERFFRSAMLAMAYRFKPDLLFEHISVIFEIDESDQLKQIATYVLAVVNRSPKQFQQMLDDIDFVTKPNIMSTLEMLRQEGVERREIIAQLEKIESVFKLCQKAIGLSDKEIASIIQLETSQVKKLSEFLVKKELQKSIKAIEKSFFKDLPFTHENRTQLVKILKKYGEL